MATPKRETVMAMPMVAPLLIPPELLLTSVVNCDIPLVGAISFGRVRGHSYFRI